MRLSGRRGWVDCRGRHRAEERPEGGSTRSSGRCLGTLSGPSRGSPGTPNLSGPGSEVRRRPPSSGDPEAICSGKHAGGCRQRSAHTCAGAGAKFTDVDNPGASGRTRRRSGSRGWTTGKTPLRPPGPAGPGRMRTSWCLASPRRDALQPAAGRIPSRWTIPRGRTGVLEQAGCTDRRFDRVRPGHLAGIGWHD